MAITKIVIRKGNVQDIDAVSALYDDLNNYLEQHVNYPGWRKGIYPAREDAVSGVEEDALFVAEEEGKIIGTVILRQRPEEGYAQADWHTDLDYASILVVYTLAVHPSFLHRGVGRTLMKFIMDQAADRGMKAIRLDVYEKNIPAMHLYEDVGFQYIDTVDLGYGMYGLERFCLYQYLL